MSGEGWWRSGVKATNAAIRDGESKGMRQRCNREEDEGNEGKDGPRIKGNEDWGQQRGAGRHGVGQQS